MAMRSSFVLWEELSDTSSQISENHWLFKTQKESVYKTRSCRRNFCNQRGIGPPQQAVSGEMDSQRHSLLILYKAKTKNFFKRFHYTPFNHKLRQAGPSYIQRRNACWGRAPNPVNCDETSQAVRCGAQGTERNSN